MGKKKFIGGCSAAILVSSMVTLSGPAVSAPQSAVFTPSNPGPFTIVDVATGTGTVAVNNAAGLITDVNVKLNDLGHTFPDDLDIELVAPAPTNKAVILMSDTGGGGDIEDIDLTFDDEAGSFLSDSGTLTSGTFKPTNFAGTGGEAYPAPAPTGTLSAFDGINPNGTWTLRWIDDEGPDSGDIEGGFTITIVTAPFSILIPGTGTSGPADPYPFNIPVSGLTGLVADVNVTLPDLSQQFMEDLDMVLVAPNGAAAQILSDVCVGAFVTDLDYVLDDEAAASMPAGSSCPAGTYKPTDVAVDTVMPAPAPAGPYPVALSTFDGISPNGTWLLYIRDDLGGGNGFFSSDPSLTFTTTDVTPPQTTITKKPRSSKKHKATIKFKSSEAGSTFKCKVDKKAFKSCTSPRKLKNLKVGLHKVKVKAIDAAGNVDGSPAKVRWRVRP